MNDRKAILDSVRLVVRALRLSSRRTERDAGISVAQLFVLRTLEEHDGLTVNELARETLTHQSSVSVVAARLVARRLVRRSVPREDRRKVLLHLTPKGRALLAAAPEAVQTRLVAALDDLGAARRRRLASLLRQWVLAAGIDAAQAPLFGEEEGRRT